MVTFDSQLNEKLEIKYQLGKKLIIYTHSVERLWNFLKFRESELLLDKTRHPLGTAFSLLYLP